MSPKSAIADDISSGRLPLSIVSLYHCRCCVQKARELGVTGGEFEPFSALTVTVPGAAAAWEDTAKMYGKLTLKEVSHNAHS